MAALALSLALALQMALQIALQVALQVALGWPLPLWRVIASWGVGLLVMEGITLISRLQLGRQPIWLLLLVLPCAFVAWQKPHRFAEFSTLAGRVPGRLGFEGLVLGAAWQNHRAARARKGLVRDQPGSAGLRASRSAEAVS